MYIILSEVAVNGTKQTNIIKFDINEIQYINESKKATMIWALGERKRILQLLEERVAMAKRPAGTPK
jgi:hypothetical protein